MKTKIILFILLVLQFGIINQIKAQNPGYLGKHFIISAEGTFSGSYFKMEKTWLKYGGNFEYIVSHKIGLGFGYLYNKTYSDEFHRSDDFFVYNGFNLKTHTFSLDFTFYDSDIAPLGDYIRLSMFYMHNYSNDFYSNGVPRDSYIDPYSAPSYSDYEISNSNYGISVTWGRRRVFFNSLIVSYGVKLGLTFKNPATYELYDFSYEFMNPYNTYNNSFFESTSSENFYSALVSFDVQIGLIW